MFDSDEPDDEKGTTVLTISLSSERRTRLSMAIDGSKPDLRESDDDSIKMSVRGDETPKESQIIRWLLWELNERSRDGY